MVASKTRGYVVAEFAGAGVDGAFQGMDQLKEVAKEIRDTISSNWVGHGQFKFEFPEGPILPTDFGDTESKYKWVPAEIFVFRAGYYSHIRATTKGQKEHVDEALKGIATEDLPTTSEAKDKKKHGKREVHPETVESAHVAMERAVERALAIHYSSKFKKVSLATKGDGIKGTANMGAFVEHYNKKYETDLAAVIPGIMNLTADKFGQEVASKITHSPKWQEKIKSSVQKAREQAAIDAYKKRRPDLTEGDIRKKITKKVLREVSANTHLSTSLAYEVMYQVLTPDMDEAAERWDRLKQKIIDASNEKNAKLQKTVKAVMDEIKETKEFMKDGILEQSDLDKVVVRFKQARAQVEAVNEEMQANLKKLESQQKKMDAAVAGRRRIGAFAVYPIASHGDLTTAIMWKNTDATMVAKPGFQPDGSVRVSFSWIEDGRVGVPFADKMFDGHYVTNGAVVFNKDGSFKGEGKIGDRFAQTYAMEAKAAGK